APNSAQTIPSAAANTAPAIQPRIAWGPPIAWSMRGIVRNGPMPQIWVKFTDSAGTIPSDRRKPVSGFPPVFPEVPIILRSAVEGGRHLRRMNSHFRTAPLVKTGMLGLMAPVACPPGYLGRGGRLGKRGRASKRATHGIPTVKTEKTGVFT